MYCIYIYTTLWETLFPIIKTSTPTVKYGGHCLRYGYTLVGKNYLLVFHIMEDTAPDNVFRMRSVHVPIRNQYRRTATGVIKRQLIVEMYWLKTSVFSRSVINKR